MYATLLFLGSGTSMGVPTLGCTCAVCTSTDPHNNRTRPSIALQFREGDEDRTILIDTGQEFRMQALRENITRADAVFYTHGHADHILGLDDLRPLTFQRSTPTPLYADAETAAIIRRIFEYTFRTENRYPTSARVELVELSTEPGTSIHVHGVAFERIPVTHGRQQIAGYRFGKAAYLTDMSGIPDDSIARLQGLDILVLDALRREPHPSHSHLENSIALAQRIGARRTYFTHISHDLEHTEVSAELPPNIYLAYDGLRLEFEIA
jgi:phosphoribosyl 1,2-cyclic phosphate phosphodiesterase